MAQGQHDRGFVSGARILSVGIASTGIFTFAYLAVASHVLSRRDYGLVSLVWALLFVVVSVIYSPIEQLISRTIADRRARGLTGHPLGVAAAIQAAFTAVFVAAALALHHPIQHGLFGGSRELYWILVVATVLYSASYFARGWLAGHEEFALYGSLVFLESVSRFAFPLAVAVGLDSGMAAVALGMAVAPLASLAVMPFAVRHLRRRAAPGIRLTPPDHRAADLPALAAAAEGWAGTGSVIAEEAAGDLTLRGGTGFATAVLAMQLSEQALMNAGVLVVAFSLGSTDLNAGLTGFVFNVMLIVRAPLQLFQAVETSILPHLAGLAARADRAQFRRALRTAMTAIGGFGAAVTVGLLAIGPAVMTLVLGDKGFHYSRLGLAVVGVGMTMHLASGTLTQAALARGRALPAAAAWLLCGGLFVAFQISHLVGSRVTRVEVGYCGAALLLAGMLWLIDRGDGPAADRQPAPAASASAT
jgi:O-antigen/teichoic acid export membrane protein